MPTSEEETLAHLTDLRLLETVMNQGLKPIKYGCIYFHRIRPGMRGSHTLNYLRKYAITTGQGLVVVDPNDLEREDLLLKRYEAEYSGHVPPELITVIVGGVTND